MNLKSPHLVTIFDVRYNDAGRPFVIMEYVSGPSLRDLLDQSRGKGLGPQKAAYFLREIAKGLTYLHDCGIVHRDLKPANIFYEDGYVKIGDYGLSKAIQPGVHSGQTVTVGTVHYMAPEIGDGQYDSSIDIYALGAVLYEMLKGHPPYEGESLGEVLMKHLSGKLDLSGINEPFASTITKAMAKNPADRFETVEEMVESIFDTEHVRTSVSLFSPNSLSVVAGRAAANVRGSSSATVRLASEGPSQSDSHTAARKASAPRPQHRPPPVPKVPPAPRQERPARVDPLSSVERWVLAAMAVGTICAVTAFWSTGHAWGYAPSYSSSRAVRPIHLDFGDAFAVMLLMSAGGIGGLLAARRFLRLRSESMTIWRLGHGGMVSIAFALAAVVATGMMPRLHRSGPFMAAIAAAAVSLLMLDWRTLEDTSRKDRLRLRHAIVGAVLAWVFAAIFDGLWPVAMGLVVAVPLGAQLLIPMGLAARPERLSSGLSRRLMVAGVTDQGPAVSPYRRWHCFGMAMLWWAGLGGVHRIYVGKTGTGILYLLTWGLGGIGQLIDVVNILSGQFRDGGGRPVVLDDDDEVSALPEAIREASGHVSVTVAAPLPRGGRRGLLNGLLTLLAVILMTGAILGSLAVAMDVPAMLAAGMGDDATARQLQYAFGGEQWRQALQSVIETGYLVLLLLAGVTIMLLRRAYGAAHMARAIPGLFGLLLATWSLKGALASVPWDLVAAAGESGMHGRAISEFASGVDGPMAVMSALLLLAAVIVLCWGPRRRAKGAA
jgi:hypothetical protein